MTVTKDLITSPRNSETMNYRKSAVELWGGDYITTEHITKVNAYVDDITTAL